MTKKWETYEQVATELLCRIQDQLGLSSVEPKQVVEGQATSWEIDAKGTRTGTGAIVVIECRRYPKSRLNQKEVAAIGRTIVDLGADGGIVVTPIGLQKGARALAKADNIVTVKLPADSSASSYILRFLNTVMAGDFVEQINGEVAVVGLDIRTAVDD
jgi:hypothetical protein